MQKEKCERKQGAREKEEIEKILYFSPLFGWEEIKKEKVNKKISNYKIWALLSRLSIKDVDVNF